MLAKALCAGLLLASAVEATLWTDSLKSGASDSLIPKVKAETRDLAGKAAFGQSACTTDCDGIKDDAKFKFLTPMWLAGGVSTGTNTNRWPYPLSPRPGLFVADTANPAMYFVEHYTLRKIDTVTGEVTTLLEIDEETGMDKYPDDDIDACNGYMNYRACNIDNDEDSMYGMRRRNNNNPKNCKSTTIAAIHVAGVNFNSTDSGPYPSPSSTHSVLHILVSYQYSEDNTAVSGGRWGLRPAKLLEIDVTDGVSASNIASSMNIKDVSAQVTDSEAEHAAISTVASTYDSEGGKIQMYVGFEYGNIPYSNMDDSDKKPPLVVWEFTPASDFADWAKHSWSFAAGASGASGKNRPPLPWRTIGFTAVPRTNLIAVAYTTNDEDYCDGCTYAHFPESITPQFKNCKGTVRRRRAGQDCPYQCFGSRSGSSGGNALKFPNAFSACSAVELWSLDSSSTLNRHLAAWRKVEMVWDISDSGEPWNAVNSASADYVTKTPEKSVAEVWKVLGLGGEQNSLYNARAASQGNPSQVTEGLSPIVEVSVAYYDHSERYYLLGAGETGTIQSVDITAAVNAALDGDSSTTLKSPSGSDTTIAGVSDSTGDTLTPITSSSSLASTPGQIVAAAQGMFPRIAAQGTTLYYLSQQQKAFAIDLSLEIPCGNLMAYLKQPIEDWSGGAELTDDEDAINLRSELADAGSDLVPWTCKTIKKTQTTTISGSSAELSKASVCCRPTNSVSGASNCCSMKASSVSSAAAQEALMKL